MERKMRNLISFRLFTQRCLDRKFKRVFLSSPRDYQRPLQPTVHCAQFAMRASRALEIWVPTEPRMNQQWWAGEYRRKVRDAAHLYENSSFFFFFPKPNLWGSSLHTDNFPSSIKAIELNKQRALMNLQLGWCRQRERVCMRDPYLYMLVNASTHLYVCMSACIYVRCSDRGSPLRYLGWASSSLSSITRGKWNTFVSDCCIGRERERERGREREGGPDKCV